MKILINRFYLLRKKFYQKTKLKFQRKILTILLKNQKVIELVLKMI